MDNKNFPSEDDTFAKNAQGISKIEFEVFLLMKVLQTKPLVKNTKIDYYDLYYTVNRNGDENKVLNDKFEVKENEYINFIDIIPNHYIGRKKDNVKLR